MVIAEAKMISFFFLKRIYFTVEASAKVVWLLSISELILN